MVYKGELWNDGIYIFYLLLSADIMRLSHMGTVNFSLDLFIMWGWDVRNQMIN